MQRGRTRKADGHDGWQVKKVELPGQRSPNVATSVHPAMGAHGQAGWPHVKPRFASPDLESMTWSAALDGKRHRCNQQPWHYTHYLLHYAPILRLGLWWHTTCGFAPCNRLLAFLKIIITIIMIMPLMVITAKLGCLPTSTELPHRAPPEPFCMDEGTHILLSQRYNAQPRSRISKLGWNWPDHHKSKACRKIINWHVFFFLSHFVSSQRTFVAQQFVHPFFFFFLSFFAFSLLSNQIDFQSF